MLSSGTHRTTQGRGRLFDNVLDTIGDTPAIRINNLGVGHATIYVKAEFFNPASSVKDRLAVAIIEEAERSGALKPGQTVVEATSGNTGIGLAMVCAQKGYPLVVTMADSFSVERRRLMRMLGAKVVLTPRAQKGFGMYLKAVELAEKNGWFLARQFETTANAAIHEATTGRVIVNDFAGFPARLFRDRLRHRRHGCRRVARAAPRAAGNPDRAQRPANARLSQAVLPTARPGGAPAPATPPSSRTRSRAGRRISSPMSCRKRSTALLRPGGADRRPKAIEWAKALAQEGSIFTGISGGATSAWRGRSRKAHPPLRRAVHAARYRAVAIFRRRSSRRSPPTWTRRNSRCRAPRRASTRRRIGGDQDARDPS